MSDDLVKRARHNALADMPHHASVELIEALADRIEELEANLGRAVEWALKECPFHIGTPDHKEWWNVRRTTLAGLTGGKYE